MPAQFRPLTKTSVIDGVVFLCVDQWSVCDGIFIDSCKYDKFKKASASLMRPQ